MFIHSQCLTPLEVEQGDEHEGFVPIIFTCPTCRKVIDDMVNDAEIIEPVYNVRTGEKYE